MSSNQEDYNTPSHDDVHNLPTSKDRHIVDLETLPTTPTKLASIVVNDDNDMIDAVPFSDQVGGHSPCARLKDNPNVVCKPSGDRELAFYQQHLPPVLKEFLPEFFGVKLVRIHAQPKQSMDDSLGIDECALSSPKKNEVEQALIKHDENANGDCSWFEHCLERHLVKGNLKNTECILLENLTLHMNKPCIMDLKMGTRTYKDDASDKKRIRAIQKAEETTTSSLGLRVCGLKLFNCDTNMYTFEDKYKGRELTPETIKDTFHRFLQSNSNASSRKFIVDKMLSRIDELRAVIASLHRFRFYSSSLLLMFDASPSDPEHVHADLRMIDFANTFCYVDGGDALPGDLDISKPDEGYLFGLDSLVTLLQSSIVD
eukprot:m.22210 g.22210  ORF g.22210 m.22210 type:complete len:372 (-) comp5434_c0_seq1:165-1280(-)